MICPCCNSHSDLIGAASASLCQEGDTVTPEHHHHRPPASLLMEVDDGDDSSADEDEELNAVLLAIWAFKSSVTEA